MVYHTILENRQLHQGVRPRQWPGGVCKNAVRLNCLLTTFWWAPQQGLEKNLPSLKWGCLTTPWLIKQAKGPATLEAVYEGFKPPE